MGFDVTIYKKCDDDTKTITHPLYKVIARLKRTKKYKMVKVSGPYSNNQYSFVFTKQFLEYQTRDWVESQYQYTFKLIGGQKTNDVLKGIYDSIYPYSPFRPTDNLTLYNEIKKCRPDMVRNIRPSAPLANYTTEDILQRPEKLIIKQS